MEELTRERDQLHKYNVRLQYELNNAQSKPVRSVPAARTSARSQCFLVPQKYQEFRNMVTKIDLMEQAHKQRESELEVSVCVGRFSGQWLTPTWSPVCCQVLEGTDAAKGARRREAPAAGYEGKERANTQVVFAVQPGAGFHV